MCTIREGSDDDYYAYLIGIIDKKTFSYTEVTASANSSYNQTFFMETDSNNVYVLWASYNNHVVYKINITNGSLTQVGETMSEQNYIMSNPIKINDYYYILFDNYSDTTGQKFIHIFGSLRWKVSEGSEPFIPQTRPMDYNLSYVIEDGNYTING